MNPRVVLITLCLGIALVALGSTMTSEHGRPTTRAAAPAQAGPRFVTVPLVIDTNGEPLGAYQLDFRATGGEVKIVGIEGSQHPAYNDPPYYDPAAMQQERVIIADFSTLPAAELPSGRVRIATVHVMVSGGVEPIFATELMISANERGEPIEARLFIDEEDES